MKRITILIIAFSVFLFYSCMNNEPKESTPQYIYKEDISGALFADTITYEVMLKYSDSTNPWKFDFIKKLDRLSLVDSIFDAVYNKSATAYDYFENKPLSVEEVKQIESNEGYSRENIGKIQFSEAWYFDKNKLIFKKEVISLTLGLELYTDGEFRGYKPVFKIMLN